MLGATWLILKTQSEPLMRARGIARPLGIAFLGLIGAVSIVTPCLLAVSIWHLWKGLRDNDDLRPFLATVAIFVLSYTGLEVSSYPNLIPMILAITAFSYLVFRGKVHPEDGYH